MKNRIKTDLKILVFCIGTVILIDSCIPPKSPTFDYTAILSGDNEIPLVVSNATGTAKFKINADSTALKFKLNVENGIDLLAAAGAHIHCGNKFSNGAVIAFLMAEIPGGFDGDWEIEAWLTQSNFLIDDCGTTIKELIRSIENGNVYVNVHSILNPGGEIRGQIERN